MHLADLLLVLDAGVSFLSPYLSTPQTCRRVVSPHNNPTHKLLKCSLSDMHAEITLASLQLAVIHLVTFCCPPLSALMLQLAEDNAFGLTQYDGFTSFFGGHPVMSQVQSHSGFSAHNAAARSRNPTTACDQLV